MSSASNRIELNLFGLTDVGQVREHNEDNFLISNLGLKSHIDGTEASLELPPEGLLLSVCDGMGGAAAGEVASQLAVDIIAEQMTSGIAASNRDELARNMVSAIEFAGGHIFQEARADRSRRGMGTTSTVAVLCDSRIYFGQVGDSRAYLLRNGELKLLTRDQSLVNQLIEAGQLTEEEAETFEHNNIILQALGTSETVQVDLTYADLQLGDKIVLCSDGLSGMIRDQEIKDALLASVSPEESCRELVHRANAAGGHDNITVIVAEVIAGPSSEPSIFGYQKYTLPPPLVESDEAFADTGDYPAPDFSQLTESPQPSAESINETRPLRVSHTMLGMKLPVELQEQSADEATATEAPSFSEYDAQTLPGAGKNLDISKPANLSREEEPVNLPTLQFSKLMLGIIIVGVSVVGAMLLISSLD